MKGRLDLELTRRGLVVTRSQAESYIRLGQVMVDGKIVLKPGYFVSADSRIELNQDEQFVSRAALKLKSVADDLDLDFMDKIVLDVGSSTGGFTDFALSRGAKKVIAVDVGTDQLHPKLRGDSRIELHEKTDIRDVIASAEAPDLIQGKQSSKLRLDRHGDKSPRDDKIVMTSDQPHIILIDVSFISLREILPHVAKNLADQNTQIVAMVKPQFETGSKMKNAGVVKNDTERRKILRDFETWTRQYFLIKNKKDSAIAGATGNRERFYLLEKVIE
ncbi:TlyA family RNA methyltransferase [Candidatus Saccharibacteria bacterium]|nr:TlyA family RNA methyltransferase [Candidatus Saccharibacteria bacterium]